MSRLILLVSILSCSRPLSEIAHIYDVYPKVYPEGQISEDDEIRINDRLYMQVINYDPQNAVFLNFIHTDKRRGSLSDLEPISYTIDKNGDIYFLIHRKIYIAGLTVKELRDLLQEKVDNYLKNTTVFVKLFDRSITVLLAVDRPDQHKIVKNRLRIFETLGTAGNTADWGNYKEEMPLRETREGKMVAPFIGTILTLSIITTAFLISNLFVQ